jgi:hypothetical protein
LTSFSSSPDLLRLEGWYQDPHDHHSTQGRQARWICSGSALRIRWLQHRPYSEVLHLLDDLGLVLSRRPGCPEPSRRRRVRRGVARGRYQGEEAERESSPSSLYLSLSFSLSLSLVECCSLNLPLKCLSRPSTTSSVRLDTSSTTRFVSSLLSDRASFLSRHLTRLLALPFDSLLPRVRSSPAPRIQSSFKPLIPSFASLLRSLYRQTHHERRIQRRSARRCLH